MNKAKLIVTRVFDSERTPQDAFVRAILNSDKYHGKRKLLCIPKFQIFCYIEFSQRQSLHIRV
ncbi:hypothetical protein C823_005785 [Eubacterium plexicaudatum ASF492]|nr:hypothetical protein C823_005785 [Eubacterium plexicaudatum ASF492]